jgi:hypothetical protein
MTEAKRRQLRVELRSVYRNVDVNELENMAMDLSMKIADCCSYVHKITDDIDNIANYAKVFIYEKIDKLNIAIAAINDVI